MVIKSGVYVSQLLTNQSLGYRNEEYVADVIMPRFIVKKDTAKIASYAADNLRVVQTLRAQGSRSNIVNHTVTFTDHYSLEEHALSELISQAEYDNAELPIEPQADAMENCLDILSVVKEKALADAMSSTGVVTQNVTLSGTDQWNDYSNSDPIGDIRTAIATVRASTGKLPNTLVFSYPVFDTLIYHPDFAARAQGAVVVNAQVVTQLLQTTFPTIKKVIVASAMYNATKEGQTMSLADIWGRNAWVMYIEPNPSFKKSRSFGFTYCRKANRVVQLFPMTMDSDLADRKSDKVRVEDEYDQKIVDVNCAYLVKNAIAS